MMRSILRSVWLATGLLFLMFITSSAHPGTGPAESIADQWSEYEAAVIDAATYKKGHLPPLTRLEFDSSTMAATVVTLTDYDYLLGQQSVTHYVWVTAVPEVQQKCKAFTESDLDLRLKQLLGLRPDAKLKYFVTMRVGARDIFRPATNPVTTTDCLCGGHKGNSRNDEYCEGDPKIGNSCVEVFPDWVRDDYKAWIANQMLTSYEVSPEHDAGYSYPWTRLGYTYDWNKGAAKQHYGASEYVIRPGAVVDVISKTSYANYCGRD